MTARFDAAIARNSPCNGVSDPPARRASRSPVPVTTSRLITLSDVRPYPRARAPQALFPIMPPSVARLCVEGSGPKRSPKGTAARCRSACTTPGSTVAVFASGSMSMTRLRWRLTSRTTPGPTALPAKEVPAPRIVNGIPRVRQTSSVARISSTCCGRTTASGGTR